ncbi:MAG: esterase family protein, partial [Anaerolineae bacterium]|nr:esterase family protein [Anaerolineae bacterium]
REGTPLLDGNRATFVWKGEQAPYLHLETDRWEATSLQEVEPGLWSFSAEFPPDAYVEYNYAVDPQDPKTIVLDPLNPRTFDSGIGHYNHYFSMPERKHTAWIERKPGVTAGTVTQHIIGGKACQGAFGVTDPQRPIWLYQPPVNEAVPLLVVYDGRDYLERGKIAEIVDNLIAQKTIQPIAMLLIENAKDQRFNEYNQGEGLLFTLHDSLLPLAREHLNLLDIAEQPGAYGVLGASMGGLMALYTALRMPKTFGRVIAQAGAFFHDKPQLPMLITQMLKMQDAAPLKIWQDVGTFDFLLSENHAMHELLLEQGCDITYREHSSGHNYTAWRDQLPEALRTLFA